MLWSGLLFHCRAFQLDRLNRDLLSHLDSNHLDMVLMKLEWDLNKYILRGMLCIEKLLVVKKC